MASDKFHEFLLAEYDHIADAHFKTNETITSLFQQYFTIAALPFTALAVAVGILGTIADSRGALVLTSALLIVVAVTGLMVLIHMSNLRFDTLLYARTINALRKYYYDHNNSLELSSLIRMRVLPQSHLVPRYLEGFEGLMPPFVVTMTIVNVIYLYGGLVSWQLAAGTLEPLLSATSVVNLVPGIFAALNVFAYIRLAQLREDKYLHSNIFGVDIDGVLNRQPIQFCDFLERNAHKRIELQAITTIPVHDIPKLGITREDERAVFNDPSYWIDMPADQDAAEVLGRLQNSMKLRVHIFTHRPWPLTGHLSDDAASQMRSEWSARSSAFGAELSRSKSIWTRARFWFTSLWRSWWPYRARRIRDWFTRETPIDSITKVWLSKHGFKYDALLIEKGSEEVADPSMEIHNRFYASRTHLIRYFVEDDLVKAEKLAHVCDVVFLINQPYNQSTGLPKNVVRVAGWKEILVHMRQLT